MTIPPVHNSIVQWNEGSHIYLNIFDTPRPYFFRFSNYEEDWEPTDFKHTSYEGYIKKIYHSEVYLYTPTTATTVEEALQLHPELFI